MTDRSAHGFLLSAALHALVVVLLLFFSYIASVQTKQLPRILELVVAGAGDNYRATEAPALGSTDSIKVSMPAALPKPEPVAPSVPEPPTVTMEKAAPTKTEPVIPNLAKNLQRQIKQAETKAKAVVAKERKEREKQEKENLDRMTKEDFDRKNRAKATEAKTPPVKVAKIDGAGIAKGVVGGSTANKQGGAGGKALTAAERSEVDAYVAMLILRLREQLEQTPGLNDGLVAEAELHIMADGRLTRARIIKGSGDEVFDLALVRAIAGVRMPERPKGLEELQIIPFTTHAKP